MVRSAFLAACRDVPLQVWWSPVDLVPNLNRLRRSRFWLEGTGGASIHLFRYNNESHSTATRGRRARHSALVQPARACTAARMIQMIDTACGVARLGVASSGSMPSPVMRFAHTDAGRLRADQINRLFQSWPRGGPVRSARAPGMARVLIVARGGASGKRKCPVPSSQAFPNVNPTISMGCH